MKEKKKIKFAFVTNIIEDKDIRLEVFYPRLGYFIPLFIWRIVLIVRALLGRGYSCVAKYDTFGRAVGYTIIIELTAKQYVSKRWLKLAKKITLKACFYAQNELRVDIIGLGSLTKSITSGGRYLIQNGITVAVTHGDAYSVASGLSGVEKMIEQFRMRDSVISVIGAYGKIGRATTLILSELGYKVIAMARDIETLKRIRKESKNTIEITDNLHYALNNSQLAIMATSAPFSIITEDLLKEDRIYYLYDIGQPYNLFPNDYWSLIKKGYKIVRVDGGFEGVNRDFDIGFWMRLNKGVMYACFVELVLQALVGDLNNYVGAVDLKHVDVTMKRAEEWGFFHLPFSCYNRPLKEVLNEVITIQQKMSETKGKLNQIVAML